ncbi:hypothetical protein HIM_06131 [Hirsutella minnesotensis 3608]|uniref:Uncharacterized protein n=1 Tax=Hirsutella minnesotensis 3608 TaxID=1043627 RepID=A0A0F7ZNY0_9HYPO|nr:hypothetical protein HIM_06131 [Hirsutella minnesotensis 3608]
MRIHHTCRGPFPSSEDLIGPGAARARPGPAAHLAERLAGVALVPRHAPGHDLVLLGGRRHVVRDGALDVALGLRRVRRGQDGGEADARGPHPTQRTVNDGREYPIKKR